MRFSYHKGDDDVWYVVLVYQNEKGRDEFKVELSFIDFCAFIRKCEYVRDTVFNEMVGKADGKTYEPTQSGPRHTAEV